MIGGGQFLCKHGRLVAVARGRAADEPYSAVSLLRRRSSLTPLAEAPISRRLRMSLQNPDLRCAVDMIYGQAEAYEIVNPE